MSTHPLYINMNYVVDIQVVDIKDFIIYVWIVIKKYNKKNERVCRDIYQIEKSTVVMQKWCLMWKWYLIFLPK